MGEPTLNFSEVGYVRPDGADSVFDSGAEVLEPELPPPQAASAPASRGVSRKFRLIVKLLVATKHLLFRRFKNGVSHRQARIHRWRSHGSLDRLGYRSGNASGGSRACLFLCERPNEGTCRAACTLPRIQADDAPGCRARRSGGLGLRASEERVG